MATIVGVHGIANTFVGSTQLSDAWAAALQSGLDEAGGPTLRPRDLTVIAYGALFRPAGDGKQRTPTRAARQGRRPFEPSDDWERELVKQWWRAAAALSTESRTSEVADERAEDPGIQPPDFEGRARMPQLIQRGLLQLAKSRFFRPFGPKVLISELRQVRLFLHDADFKRVILARLAAKIAPDTRIIVGHSLGSVVAYEALCAHPEWRIDTLVTLGSPLGIPNVVFEALSPKPRQRMGTWPNVARWVNIADKGDLVALVKTLAPLFGPVQDVLVYNGWQSHDVTRYLSAVETGRPIAEALNQGDQRERANTGV